MSIRAVCLFACITLCCANLALIFHEGRFYQIVSGIIILLGLSFGIMALITKNETMVKISKWSLFGISAIQAGLSLLNLGIKLLSKEKGDFYLNALILCVGVCGALAGFTAGLAMHHLRRKLQEQSDSKKSGKAKLLRKEEPTENDTML
jgi:hypothetical protein